MAGRSINLFVPDTDQSDLRVATVPNWAGSIVTASEGNLGALLGRAECVRHGCYIMMSGDRYDGDAQAYIGQTHNLQQRLSSPSHKERGWEKIAFISTSDQSFSEGHFLYLEATMIANAGKVGAVKLQNGNQGRTSMGNLGEAQEAAALAFFEDVKFVLPVIGFDIFSDSEAKVKTTSYSSSRLELVLLKHKKMLAEATLGNGFVRVNQGATVQPVSNHASDHSYLKLRSRLEDEGVIDGDQAFTRDYDFKSPSAASAVILGRNDNGRVSWKLKSDPKVSLGDWQQSQKEFENG